MGSLPTGTFAVPLGIAQESSPNCLTVLNQLTAWSCKMTFAPLVLSVEYTNGQPRASLGGLPKPDGSVQYGIQPPELSMRPMQLVKDLDNPLYGPAYHFSAMYDKLIVLNQGQFAAGDDIADALRSTANTPYRHRFQVMPGDSPWFCYWNRTYIEGYIYVKGNSTAATFTNFPTAWTTVPHGPSIPVETGQLFSSNDAIPIPTHAYDPPSIPTETPSPQLTERGDGEYPRHVPYPRIVKIEDRRLPGSPPPYCQKMSLLDDGNIVPALDSAHLPIKIYLQEDSPSLEEFLAPEPSSTHSPRRGADLLRRADPASACHCQWMFQ